MLPAASTVLTAADGWRPGGLLIAGDSIITDAGWVSIVHRRPVKAVSTNHVRLGDGTELLIAAGQRLDVIRHGEPLAEVLDSVAPCSGVRLPAVTTPVRFDRAGERPLVARGVPPLLHPRLVGWLLGDGALSLPDTVRLWTNESQIVAGVRSLLPDGATLSRNPVRQPSTTGWTIVGTRPGRGCNPVLAALRELRLLGRHSYDKFIPDVYKYGSPEVRRGVLEGLMDTDGAVDPAGQVTFCTASPRLAQDLQELIQSLGGRCSLRVHTGIRYTSRTQRMPKPARDSYRLGGIRIPGVNPFTLSRKAERVRPVVRLPLWAVREVVPIGLQPAVELTLSDRVDHVYGSGFVPLPVEPALLDQAECLALQPGRVA